MTCKTCKHREDCDLFLRSGCDTSVGALFDCQEYVFEDEYSKGLEALKDIALWGYQDSDGDFIIVGNQLKDEFKIIQQELKALDIIKDFVWIENGEIHLGLYGDSEIVLRKNDFENKEEYDLLKEVLL